MASNSTFRQRIEEHQSTLTEEREWWNRKKASIQEGFMKELEQESTKAGSNTKNLSSATAGQSTEAPAPSGSDDDAVLVESGGPAVAGTPTSGGGKKKKKGKK
jgi:translocation protein SEC66